ncbi:uncharacterized protein LOC131613200 [Vicia villosa]|uniref:uncharacterized protein LOC131613200 n=1 Tax=Vicia villosa TaxID=3911 RepID=UPI00273AF49D|nr:uncharacterized protein LOC131613200 [Vicia villosa]
MSAKFNYVVCSIEESNDVTTLSIDELQSSLLVHEQRMQGPRDHSEEQALKMSNWEDNVNYVEYKEEILLMVYSEENEKIKEETWYIDSGCSNHMVGTKKWFFDFDDKFRESVRLGNDSKMAVIGKGNVKLCVKGRIHVITNVYYIPGLGNNLLRVGQLQ